MATISDVAKLAGVSVATVSRVINNTGAVRPTTRQRVEEAIEELSYEPNALARNFRRDESRVLLILTPNITNPYYAHIITGINDEAARRGYMSFISTATTQEQQKAALGMLSSKQADGAILLAAGRKDRWLDPYFEKYPLVLCSEFDPDSVIPHISIDNYRAGRDAMSYLFSQGHRRIATISSVNDYHSTLLRRKAYEDAMSRQRYPIKEEYIYLGAEDYNFSSGKDGMFALLDLQKPPTAVFAISDTLALGAVVGAQERGLRVPEDISVLGFDDVENTTMLHPYITTIAQPCRLLGQRGAELLCRQIKKELVATTTVLNHELIIRESVAQAKR